MENGLDALKIAVTVIITAVVLTMVFSILRRGVFLFNSSTDDVIESVHTFTDLSMRMYNQKSLPYSALYSATINMSDKYEIRFQTLEMQDNGDDPVVYPGTSKESTLIVCDFEDTIDKNGEYYLNKESSWYTTYGEDENIPFILFQQEK